MSQTGRVDDDTGPGDGWTEADDAWAMYESVPDFHPVRLSEIFTLALRDIATYRPALERLVTPESLESWDFEGASEALDGLGLLTKPRAHMHAPDVVYVYAVDRGGEAHIISHPEVIQIEQVFSWVWRPELDGGWRLHSITPHQPTPETIPRTSPGQAPDVGSLAPRALSGTEDAPAPADLRELDDLFALNEDAASEEVKQLAQLILRMPTMARNRINIMAIKTQSPGYTRLVVESAIALAEEAVSQVDDASAAMIFNGNIRQVAESFREEHG